MDFDCTPYLRSSGWTTYLFTISYLNYGPTRKLSLYNFSDCLSSQNDVANNVFTPAAALSTDIGLCRIDESSERVGILMVRNNGVWGSVGVSYFPILSYDIQVE